MGRQKKRTSKKYNHTKRKNNTLRKNNKKRVRKTNKKRVRRTRKRIGGSSPFDYLNPQDNTNATGSITDDPNNPYQFISDDGGMPLVGNPVTQSAPGVLTGSATAPTAPQVAALPQQGVAEGAAQAVVAEEKRVDPSDGVLRTKEEFLGKHNNDSLWNYVGQQLAQQNQINQLLEAAKMTDLNNNPQLQQQINNLEKKNNLLQATTGLATTAGLIGAIGLPATAGVVAGAAGLAATGAAAIKTKNVALSGVEKYKRYDSMKDCRKCLKDMVDYHVVTKKDGDELLKRYDENRPEVKITHKSSNLKSLKNNIKNAKNNPANTPLN